LVRRAKVHPGVLGRRSGCGDHRDFEGAHNRSQSELRLVIMQKPRVSHRVIRTAWASFAAATLACIVCSCTSGVQVSGPNAATAGSTEAASSLSDTGVPNSAHALTQGPKGRVETGSSPTRGSVNPKSPMIVLRLVPQGGSCAFEGTQIPAITVYRDGSVLMSDDGGFYCEPLPRVTTGRIDATWAAEELARYFDSAASRSDMTTLDGNVGVADGSTTDLTITGIDGIDGIDHHAAAYVLDIPDLGLSADKTAARSELRAVLANLRHKIIKGASWMPDSLRIIKPPWWVPNVNGQSRWPTAASHAVQSVIAGGEGSCAIVTGSEAAAVRKSQGSKPAMSTWLINGKEQRVAIGIVIPGLEDGCSIE